MMTARDSILAEIARIERLIADAAEAEARLPGLKFALDLVPEDNDTARNRVRPSSAPRTEKGGSKGRQPGAISKRWQKLYSVLYQRNSEHDFDLAHLIRAVRDVEGREIRSSEAKRQVEMHAEYGYVEILPGIKFHDYRVTEYAAEKFGFGNEAAPSAKAPEADERGVGGGPQGGASHPTPAGSTPADSIPSHLSRSTDLDDEIPF